MKTKVGISSDPFSLMAVCDYITTIAPVGESDELGKEDEVKRIGKEKALDRLVKIAPLRWKSNRLGGEIMRVI